VLARRRLRRLVAADAVLVAAVLLTGCVPIIIGGAAAGGGYMLAQERSPGENIRDVAVGAQVSKSWKEFNPELAEDVDATVYQGRVLLTGRVPNEDWRAEAVKRTWRVEGVKEVYDEIEIGPSGGFWRNARDTTITTQLRVQLVADEYVRSVNYTIDTVNGTVYVIGSARSQAELNRVTDHARNIANVRRVVSYVRIRPGEGETAAATTPPPAAERPPAPASDGPPPDYQPAPRQSIEVTPLH
jgi:osmotically-inducible protein OsmY